MWTLVNRYGGTKGRWTSFEIADQFRLMLDDWWMWSVIRVDEI